MIQIESEKEISPIHGRRSNASERGLRAGGGDVPPLVSSTFVNITNFNNVFGGKR